MATEDNATTVTAPGTQGAANYARLIQMHAPAEDFERILAVIKDRVVPAVRQLPGFRSDYFAGDAGQGRLVSFVLFDSAEGLAAAEALFQKMRAQIEQMRLQFDSVENLQLFVGG